MELLLLSGGLESVALAYRDKPKNALTIDYGNTTAVSEIKASKKICEILDIQHFVFKCDLRELGFGELFQQEKSLLNEIKDWTPFRNQFLITIGCMFAAKLGLNKIIIGTVKDDDNYVDGTRKFVGLIKTLVGIQEGNIDVCAPAITESSIELIKSSKIPLDVLYWSFSCNKSRYACGACMSCRKRDSILEKLRKDSNVGY